VLVEIAPVTFSSWNSLHSLLRESFAYMDARIDPPSSLNGMSEDDLRARARREHLIVAYDDSRLVGCAYADVRSTCVYVGKIAVASGARGRGIARELLAAADSIAQAANIKLLELQTRVELIENHATFRALGFEIVAETAHPGYSRPTSVTMQRTVQNRPE
jgi:ribosomal protein S18 acetylase RimI-like enzyme